jgi:hypothetical protein
MQHYSVPDRTFVRFVGLLLVRILLVHGKVRIGGYVLEGLAESQNQSALVSGYGNQKNRLPRYNIAYLITRWVG